MRTTVTLDPDVEAAVRRLMAERGVGFKQALNDAVRAGAQSRPRAARFRTQTHRLGVPLVSLDRALQLAGDLEDEELLRRMERGQ